MKKVLLALLATGIISAANAGTATSTLTLNGTVASSCATSLSTGTLSFTFVPGSQPSAQNSNLTLACSVDSTITSLTATSANGWRFTGATHSANVNYIMTAASVSGTSAGNFNIVGIGGVLVTGSLNTETISITGGGLTWVTVTGSTQAMAANTGYVGNNATLITFTLPATAAVGDTYIIEGLGTGGWTITLNSGQLIHMGNLATTVTSGSLSSTNQYDSVTINCVVANTTFTFRGSMGNIIVV